MLGDSNRNYFFLFGIFGFLILGGFGLSQDAHAATITAAAGGGDWNTGSTWVGGVVPADSDDKVIPTGVTVTVTTNVVNTGNISNSGTIAISNSVASSVGINNNTPGTITNNAGGLITIANTGTSSIGISNFGSGFTNDGTITITNTTGLGIFSTTFRIITNNAGGIINVQNTGGTGISNPGTINSSGTISITNTTGVGIANSTSGSLNNLAGGQITISNTGGTGINNQGFGTITTNSGTITISNSVNFTFGITGNVTNNAGGLITISNTASFGMRNGNYSNSGTITITSSAFGVGIDINNARNLTNNVGGIVNVQNSSSSGIDNQDTITNNGTINVANTGLVGIKIFSSGHLINNGTVTVSITVASTTGIQVGFKSDLTNNSGGIVNVTNSNGTGIFTQSEGVIINNTGGQFTVANSGGRGIHNTETVTNDGTFSVENTGTSSTGIYNPALSFIVNNASFSISNTSGTGIFNLVSGLFTNSATGTLTISENGGFGFRNLSGATLSNLGTINVSKTNTGGSGIFNLGTVNNSGALNVLCNGVYSGTNPVGNPINFVACVSDLSITKADDIDPVISGQNFVYTITVFNAGPDPATAVIVTDTLPPEVTFVATSGCLFGPASIPDCNLDIILAGESASYTIEVTADQGIGLVTNSATVNSNSDDPNLDNNSIEEDTTINPSIEHYLSYQINESKGTPKFESTNVGLNDQFSSGEFKVKQLYRLFNPVDKNDEGLTNEENHLVGYRIQGKDKVRETVLVENQFGILSLDIKNERLLLVPSSKNHTSTPDSLKTPSDHFKCYDVKVTKGTPNFKKLKADVYDPNFEEDRTMDVKKPRYFCNPVEKIHDNTTTQIISPDDHLVCYDVKKSKGQPNHDRTSVFTNNQFGPEALDTKKERELCVPSKIIYPDNDYDGLPANEDPDDSDPCNPSVNNQVCQAITNSPGEHFMSYQVKETKNTPKFQKFYMDLADKFGYGDFKVKKILRLLNPVDKNNEGIQDEITHMVGYQIQKQDYTKYDGYDQIMVANQFGLINLDVKKPKVLLVPSAKSHDSIPDVLLTLNNKFTCYDVKVTKGTPNFKKIKADVYDPNFDEDRIMDIKKPRIFCISMQTNNVIKAPNEVYGEQLLCYDVKKSKGEPNHDRTSVFTNNYFGPEELDTKKEKELCVPSTIIKPGMTQVNPPN